MEAMDAKPGIRRTETANQSGCRQEDDQNRERNLVGAHPRRCPAYLMHAPGRKVRREL